MFIDSAVVRQKPTTIDYIIASAVVGIGLLCALTSLMLRVQGM